MTSSKRSARPPLRVYLAGEGALWRVALLREDRLPWNHRQANTIEEADAVFLWAWNALPTTRLGLELGLATALLKPIYVGAYDNNAVHQLRESLSEEMMDRYLSTLMIHTDVKEAYERVMADVDVSLPDTYVLKTARTPGVCKGCGCTYKTDDKIRQAKRRNGAYHADCYVRMKDPSAIDAALFNAALVDSLRIDNIQLEQALRDKQH